MEDIVIIAPHLSTGGAPQFTLNKIELLINDYNIHCIEYNLLSNDYTIQRDKIIDLIGKKFISLSNKNNLNDILSKINPNIILLEEFPETFMKYEEIEFIYNMDSVIVETTHNSKDLSNIKKWLPNKFIFVSEHSVDVYSHFGVDYEVIEYPVDITLRNKEKSKEKLKLDCKKTHILNVGLFTPNKNQKEIFEIAKYLPNTYFHFIGNLAPNFEEYWKPLIENKPDNCIIWGERNDVIDFIEASDLILFTSKSELNPIFIKECLRYEDLPILIYDLEIYKSSYDTLNNIYYIDNNLNKTISKINELTRN